MLKLGFQEDVEKIMNTLLGESTHEKIQVCLFSATIPFWVKNVAKKYLDQSHVTVDLAKELKNKTAKTVNHLAICVPFHTRT
jgi:ATP-dependent RNA helicase DDX21